MLYLDTVEWRLGLTGRKCEDSEKGDREVETAEKRNVEMCTRERGLGTCENDMCSWRWISWEGETGKVTEVSECLVAKCVHCSIMEEKP